jgi:membrane fusion protein (multidrug efflux system)
MDSAALPEPKPNVRKRVLIALVVVFAVAGTAWFVSSKVFGVAEVTTDNANVNGNQVFLMPQVAGTVVSISVEETQFVRAGQPLVELDGLDAEVALRQSASALAETVRQVRQQFETYAQLLETVKQREAELARAAEDLDRRKPLLADAIVAPEDVAHARSAVAVAQAALAAAQRQAAVTQAFIRGATPATHPSVQRARAAYLQAAVAAERNHLVAPVDGLVAKRSVQLGQRVSSGASLMALIPLDQVWVDANFKESQLADVRIGQPATLTADLYGGKVEYRGKVFGLGAGTGAAFAALPAQNATGNWIKVVQRVPVRIALDPQELAKHPLRIGLSMAVRVGTADTSGPTLAQAPSAASAPASSPFAIDLAAIERRADTIVAANLGEGFKAAGHAP